MRLLSFSCGHCFWGIGLDPGVGLHAIKWARNGTMPVARPSLTKVSKSAPRWFMARGEFSPIGGVLVLLVWC